MLLLIFEKCLKRKRKSNPFNMISDDGNDVVRYVMEEMEPSEEVLMERAMMEDDDLLIEVESMRQTMQRLDELPERKPPAELSESIIREAGNYQKSRKKWAHLTPNLYKYAAVLIIGFGLGGGLWFFMNFYYGPQGNVQQASVSIASSKNARVPHVKPWVDRHHIIYYQAKYSSKSGYRAIQQASLSKLTPVQQPLIATHPSSSRIHLTSEERP